ncbi:MAG: HPP family protein [Acidimicrobiales bacterium]
MTAGTSRTSRVRLLTGLRFAIIVGISVGVAGAAGRGAEWPAITAALGPTAYIFAAHPESEAARWRNGVIGHAVGIAAGLASLAVFGLWNAPGQGVVSPPTWPVVGASAVAIAVTLVVLELVGSHHAPAGATSLLVATGLASPGRPLEGLVLGLVVVLVLGPLLGQWLPLRPRRNLAGPGSPEVLDVPA